MALAESDNEFKSPYAADSVTWREVIGLCAVYWARQKSRMFFFILIMLTQTALDLVIPIVSGVMVDRLIRAISGDVDYSFTLQALYMFTAASVTYQFLRFVRFRIFHRLLLNSMDSILKEAFGKVQRFSTDWHANTFAGATVRKLTRGKWAFDAITAIIWNNFIPVAVMVIGLSIYISLKFPLIGAMFLATVAIYIITACLLAVYYVRPKNELAAKSDSAVGATLADMLTNNSTIKSFGAEIREDNRFGQMTGRWAALTQVAWDRGATMFFIQKAIYAALQFGLIFAFIQMVQNGRATAGDVVFILTANTMLSAYLRVMGEHIRQLQQSSSEIADMVDIFRRPIQVADQRTAKGLINQTGQIEFDDVTFKYGDGSAPLYKDFSLNIRSGEVVGLVGPSGSGKSTFVKLIQRLYDINSGTIRISGQPIDEVTQSDLRRQIALVPQDPALFHRSLAENIAYAKPDATLDEIKAAARKAHAAEFIERLALGYDTLVGERGVKLSGGERQRVAIARAFLADSPIVIFDEATSSLDTITEKLIQDAMAELMKGRTTLVIAHRLSTVREVDRILVFDRGRIIEQGSHDELIARERGRYRALYEMQAQAA